MRSRIELRLGFLVLFVISATSLSVTALFVRRDGGASNRVYAAEMTADTGEPGLEVSNGQAESCPAGMIAYWHLDETSGTTFAERIQGNDASCSGATCPAFAPGQVNGALVFDGVDDMVDAPHHPDFTWLNGDSFSIEVWVQTSACNNTAFFSKHLLNSATWWLGCGNSGNRPAFALRDNVMANPVRIEGSTSIADGAWHHLVGVRDGATQENRLYVDGVLAAQQVVNYSGDFANTNPLQIGYHYDSYWANATIDEVAAYNRVLTAQEVARHHEAGRDAGSNYCNGVPIALNGNFETEMGVSVPVTFAYNDPDGPGPYTVTIVDAPVHGTITGSGLQRTYTPDAGFKGMDSFTWRINDSINDSNVATTTVNVLANGENEPPVAASQSVTTTNKSPLVIELTYTDPDGGSDYTVTIVDGPDHGTLSGTGTTRTYTPNGTFVGEDSFTWMVNDGFDNSNVATVSIEVLDSTSYLYLPVISRP